jgi:hypothetical protein
MPAGRDVLQNAWHSGFQIYVSSHGIPYPLSYYCSKHLERSNSTEPAVTLTANQVSSNTCYTNNTCQSAGPATLTLINLDTLPSWAG